MTWRRARLRDAAVLAMLGLVVLAAASCGGGGSSASTTQATGSAGSGASSTPEATGSESASQGGSGSKAATAAAGAKYGSDTRAAAAAAEHQAKRRQRAVHRRLARTAGRAAPFLVEQGDNSIPTYGREASGGQRAPTERALAGYLAARAQGDWATACSFMSVVVRKQLEALVGTSAKGESSCPTAYATLAGRGTAQERADPLVHGLTALRVESPHAFALFYGAGGQQYMMPMEEEGEGAWEVNQIAPVPWPIGAPAAAGSG